MADLDDKALSEIEGELLRGMGIDTSVALNLVDALRKARADLAEWKEIAVARDDKYQAQIQLNVKAEAQIAAVRALQRCVAFANDATPAVNGAYVFYSDLIRALDGDGAQVKSDGE